MKIRTKVKAGLFSATGGNTGGGVGQDQPGCKFFPCQPPPIVIP
jgi:hypothetical protein